MKLWQDYWDLMRVEKNLIYKLVEEAYHNSGLISKEKSDRSEGLRIWIGKWFMMEVSWYPLEHRREGQGPLYQVNLECYPPKDNEGVTKVIQETKLKPFVMKGELEPEDIAKKLIKYIQPVMEGVFPKAILVSMS